MDKTTAVNRFSSLLLRQCLFRVESGRPRTWTEAILRIQDVREHWWIDLTRGEVGALSDPRARVTYY
jgi:hypothetical protein